jgi:hypothetical protein
MTINLYKRLTDLSMEQMLACVINQYLCLNGSDFSNWIEPFSSTCPNDCSKAILGLIDIFISQLCLVINSKS